MYLIVIGWVYVVLMMCVTEATNSNGTLLGALITFVLYGVVPVTLVVYLMGAPARRKAIKLQEAESRQAGMAQAGVAAEPSVHPDTGSHATGGAEAISTAPGVTPVRKEP